jgi:YebC/PmpR family DNA-binding regulatory protein
MSGHSKWATTKHKKAVIDARRAKSWAKLIKNIEVAAKLGGADQAGNPTLFDAVLKAKKTSVPKDNIDRAIKRGAGIGGESVEYTSIMYEGYGPNGVALMIECLTDNKNRAAAEVRTALSRNGGTLADPGSVAYNFSRKGVIVVSGEGTTEDDVMMAALEAGAEEIEPHAEGLRGHHRGIRPRGGPLGARGRRHRVRVGRRRVRPEPQGRDRRRHGAQDLPPDRRAGRQRRRAERLQQLRPHRRQAELEQDE